MLPTREYVDWLFRCADWQLRELGVTSRIEDRASIVLPTQDDFPVDLSLRGHALVEDYFAFVKEHANLSEWPFELVPHEPGSPAGALAGMPHHMTEAPVAIPGDDDDAIHEGDPLIIPYDPTLIRTPDALVAALALGAAHYFAQDTPSPPPGGDEQLDHAVDVTAVFLGFGVFTANAALLVESFESGPMVGQGVRRLGSLGPLEIAYALALRVELIGADLEEVREHLRPNPRAWVVDATRDLRASHAERIEALRRIERPALGPYRS